MFLQLWLFTGMPSSILDEEAMMRDKKYPLAGSHTKLHDELVVRLLEIASTPIEDNEHYFYLQQVCY